MQRKKLPTCRIQRLIEHLLPFNFTVQYLPGEKMHIADTLSRLTGKDLEPSDQLIPISFNVYTRSTQPLIQPQKLYTTERYKPSQLPPSYIPQHKTLHTHTICKNIYGWIHSNYKQLDYQTSKRQR